MYNELIFKQIQINYTYKSHSFVEFPFSQIRIRNKFYFRNSRIQTGCFRANNSLNHKLTDARTLLFDIIRTGLTEMSQLRLQTVRSSVDIEWGDPTKKGTGSTTGHEHVLLSILAINARYSVYLMTVLVQFLRERGKEKKRKALNLDAKSLLNGSWQTMGDVNLFILLRMYRASCITLLPRVLRVDVYYFLLYYIEILPYDVVRYRSFKIFPFIFEYLNIIIPFLCTTSFFSRIITLSFDFSNFARRNIKFHL